MKPLFRKKIKSKDKEWAINYVKNIYLAHKEISPDIFPEDSFKDIINEASKRQDNSKNNKLKERK